jgi:hypothetical protein
MVFSADAVVCASWLPTMVGKRATMKALPDDGLRMVDVCKQVHATQAKRGNSG